MSKIEVELPEGTTTGDLLAASGAIMGASTNFVDWEKLHDGTDEAISYPGRVLLSLAHQIAKGGRT